MDYLDDKERERRILQNEKCAKLREEIARDLEDERKRMQQELIRQGDENAIRKQECARKMAEAKRRKQIEEEKRLAKIEEEEKLYYTNLQQNLYAIGADMTWQKNKYGYSCTVTVHENIDIKEMFALLKDDDYDSLNRILAEVSKNTESQLTYITRNQLPWINARKSVTNRITNKAIADYFKE